jgi:UDP-N-acetylmuramoyl-tripeptide--D-alanyl-D-alanine ligase
VGVIGVDHPLLAELARARRSGMKLMTVSSSGADSDLFARSDRIYFEGRPVAGIPEGVFPLNLAVALGIGLALGVDLAEMTGRIDDLPVSPHRQSTTVSESGVSIIDDTFNSNPDGARVALATLQRIGASGVRAVVTPGMVELGPIQNAENRQFAAAASRAADHLVIVGVTNRRALLAGSAEGEASVTVVPSREEAVRWVRARLGPGDAVLYENDLPDHYP